jgi:hypothetical protein
MDLRWRCLSLDLLNTDYRLIKNVATFVNGWGIMLKSEVYGTNISLGVWSGTPGIQSVLPCPSGSY